MRNRLLLLGLALPLIGSEPSGYKHWSGAQLLENEKSLAPKMNARKVASERVATWGNHYALLLHREASGEAELHEHQADLIIVQSGTASLVVGGTIPKSRTTTRGEIRGAAIEGGAQQKISAGDIIHVPSKTPHQILLDPGQQLNYFTLKVNE